MEIACAVANWNVRLPGLHNEGCKEYASEFKPSADFCAAGFWGTLNKILTGSEPTAKRTAPAVQPTPALNPTDNVSSSKLPTISCKSEGSIGHGTVIEAVANLAREVFIHVSKGDMGMHSGRAYITSGMEYSEADCSGSNGLFFHIG